MSWKRTFARRTKQLRGVSSSPKIPARLTDGELQRLLELVNENSHPNLNPLSIKTRNLELLALNVKAMGYHLARSLGETLAEAAPAAPPNIGLGSKLSTQADMESEWFAYWCHALRVRPIYHRKLWEFAYVLQALHEADLLKSGVRGLGFGCGTEPMASYFASRGVQVTMTDLSLEDMRASGWATSNQHAQTLLHAHNAVLVDQETFLRQVEHRNVDMNAIPEDLQGYDFCWSICAFEHLGSIEAGLNFVENSLTTLRPGGVSVHTTEFNMNPDGPTIDNWPSVLFQRRHIEALAERLQAQGHAVATMDFDQGAGPLDHFIDLPPWHEGTLEAVSRNLGEPLHLKVGIDGFPCTCLGLIVTKRG